MLAAVPGRHRVTVAADKAYDAFAFVAERRQMDVTPHTAQQTTKRRSAIDRRTPRHAGDDVSQRKRTLVEHSFAWMKTVASLRKLRHRGGTPVTWIFTFTAAAYNMSDCAACCQRRHEVAACTGLSQAGAPMPGLKTRPTTDNNIRHLAFDIRH